MTHKSASAPEPCSQSSRKPPVEQGRSAAAVRKRNGEAKRPGRGPFFFVSFVPFVDPSPSTAHCG